MSQDENIQRVNTRITLLVSEFCRDSFQRFEGLFYMEELRTYISERMGGYIAPDSPGRILRLMRAKGKIEYTVLSRSKSLYEVKSVAGI